jgi:putative hydrolase of the HAD superfamily
MLRAALFDWGGTLTTLHAVDLLDAWRVVASVLAPDDAERVAAALLAVEDEVWSRTTTTMRSATTREVLSLAAERLSLPVDEALHERAVSSYLAHWAPTTAARPDAAATLRSVRARGLRTGLLSNTHWPRHQHEAWLARDGLLELLDARIYTSDLTHTKPHPEAFRALLDELGLSPAECVFVGDRLWDDVHGAAELGMRTVWLRNDVVPAYDVTPDAAVDELLEVVDVVNGWLA